MRRNQRVSNRRPRHHSKAPNNAAAIMKKPIAEHDAEAEEHVEHRRPVLRRHALQAGKQAVRIVREDQRRAARNRDLEMVFLRLLVRPGEDMEVAGLRCRPSAPSIAATLIG